MVWHSESDTIHIYQPELTGMALKIKYCLTITNNLRVLAFRDNIDAPLTLDFLSDTRQIDTLLNEFTKLPSLCTISNTLNSFENHIKQASNHITLSISRLFTQFPDLMTDDDSEHILYLSHLQFIECQLKNALVHKNRRRYNVITQVMALKAHLISPACYRYLQSLDCLSLPHPQTLQKFYSKFGLESDFSAFLKQATSDFSDIERNVILQMDEIHVQSTVDYKGGRIIGYSMSSN